MKYLVTFFTHFDAIQYVKFLKTIDILGTLYPVPRQISSSCGTCVIFDSEKIIDDKTVYKYINDGCNEFFIISKSNYNLIYSDNQ